MIRVASFRLLSHASLRGSEGWRTAVVGLPYHVDFPDWFRAPALRVVRSCSKPLFPQHGGDLVEASDAGVHFHRLVEAVGVRGGVAAPAAFAHHDGREVEVEGLAHAGL